MKLTHLTQGLMINNSPPPWFNRALLKRLGQVYLLFSQWAVSRNNIEILHSRNFSNWVFRAHEVDIDTFQEHHMIQYRKMFEGLERL